MTVSRRRHPRATARHLPALLAHPPQAHLVEALLGEAHLREAHLGEAHLREAHLRGAHLPMARPVRIARLRSPRA
jgi:hypothetical protein